jgi:hypothetical protein
MPDRSGKTLREPWEMGPNRLGASGNGLLPYQGGCRYTARYAPIFCIIRYPACDRDRGRDGPDAERPCRAVLPGAPLKPRSAP